MNLGRFQGEPSQTYPLEWDAFLGNRPKKAANLGRSNSRHWAKVPLDVVTHEGITLEHLQVYAALSGSVPRGSNVAQKGMRSIAEILGISRMTASRRVSELESWGLIEPIVVKNGYRGSYKMLSPVFDRVTNRVTSQPVPRRGAGSVRQQASAWAKLTADRAKETA